MPVPPGRVSYQLGDNAKMFFLEVDTEIDDVEVFDESGKSVILDCDTEKWLVGQLLEMCPTSSGIWDTDPTDPDRLSLKVWVWFDIL